MFVAGVPSYSLCCAPAGCPLPCVNRLLQLGLAQFPCLELLELRESAFRGERQRQGRDLAAMDGLWLEQSCAAGTVAARVHHLC
jgi:hypothetical protein